MLSSNIESPIVISEGPINLYGILRSNDDAKKLVILLPAPTGTRIGPQRSYVQIARKLLQSNIASLCIDLPTFGDSYDKINRKFGGDLKQRHIALYKFYLDRIVKYIEGNYNFKETILLSISVGCIPVLTCARLKTYSRVILLSPNHLSEDVSLINKRNIQAYIYKIFRWNTWWKLFALELDFRRILNNVSNIPILYSLRKRIGSEEKETFCENANLSNNVKVLCIFGEKDFSLKKCQRFWKKYNSTGNIASYDEIIIENSDHSFFGWEFKERVTDCISKWISED